MKILWCCLLATVLLALPIVAARAQEETPDPPDQPAATQEEAATEETAPEDENADDEPLPEEYSCMFCHGSEGTLSGDDETAHLIITEDALARDIHWQKGLRCHDCHGGNPLVEDFVDHRDDDGFHSLAKPNDIPEFCGRCHSSIEYMPSPRTDQVAEFRTSGHGLALEKNPEDTDVATCVSCHGHHNIRTVDDLQSPVYPTRLAETCATCHSDAKKMEGRQYGDKPLGHDQFDLWKQSVHAHAMLEEGDISAPTCNDCHGNHGALPPEVGSVANACGSCHVKVASLFAETLMKHRFEEVNLPGCVTCHGNHHIQPPTDEMLKMEDGGVCAECHAEGKYGATLAGAETTRKMRDGIESLKKQIAEAEEKLDEGHRLGMLVAEPQFKLRDAQDALTNARSLIHAFALEPVEEALAEGAEVAAEVDERAEAILKEHTYRRVWLATFLIPILLVTVLLVLYIRKLPIPGSGG